MVDRAFLTFQDVLNRSLNSTISAARLTVVVGERDPSRAVVGYHESRKPPKLTSMRLGNGHYLGILMAVHVSGGRVTTDETSISYHRSLEGKNEDWIFRYDYAPRAATLVDYAYPVAHLHINAEPPHFQRVGKPFCELHFPTRRLSLEAIIRHLIVEHDVPTLVDRQRALDTLAQQQAEFERLRTDPDKPHSAVVAAQSPG